VVFRIIPEQTTIITEVLNGALDAIVENIQPEQATQIEGQDAVELMRSQSRSYTYIGWNNERPRFSDARVRRALTMAINRPALIEAILHGYGVVAEGMVPPLSPMFTPLDPLPYDPQGAAQLMTQAGWRDSNGDGIVERDGRPFEMTLLVSSASRTNQDVATVVQQQLRQIGVDVEIQAVEFQAMIRQHRAREYDGVISNWTLDTFKIDPTPLFSCVEARKPQSANRAGYCNPRADSLIEQGLRTTDPAAAKLIWADFQRLLQQDQPITFLYWRDDLTVVGRRLRGLEADARARLITAADWWIPAELRN
jgi:peptide/nickel transport system substrate-binding protein